MAVELASELLEILACPNCHGGLAVDHDRDELVCTAPDCQLAYPVRDGIPILLIDEARPPKKAVEESESDKGPGSDKDPETDKVPGPVDGSTSAEESQPSKESGPAASARSAESGEAQQASTDTNS